MNSAPPLGPDWRLAHLVETFKAIHTIAVEGLKMLAIINGGAAVAVLTYVGNTAKLPAHIPGALVQAVLCYCLGLVATTLAFIAGYMTELKLYNEALARAEGRSVRSAHQLGVYFGGALAFFAAVAFGLGCWRAVIAFSPEGCAFCG